MPLPFTSMRVNARPLRIKSSRIDAMPPRFPASLSLCFSVRRNAAAALLHTMPCLRVFLRRCRESVLRRASHPCREPCAQLRPFLCCHVLDRPAADEAHARDPAHPASLLSHFPASLSLSPSLPRLSHSVLSCSQPPLCHLFSAKPMHVTPKLFYAVAKQLLSKPLPSISIPTVAFAILSMLRLCRSLLFLCTTWKCYPLPTPIWANLNRAPAMPLKTCLRLCKSAQRDASAQRS